MDFRFEMEEVKYIFRSNISLMKSDMITKIVSALGGIPRHVGTEVSYEEIVEDFEVTKSSGEDRSDHVEIPTRIRAG